MRCEICQTKFTQKFMGHKWCCDICKKLYQDLNKPKPISNRSDKRAEQEVEYKIKRDKYMDANPLCECCKSQFSEDLHHKKGRIGDLLTDERYFMAVSREHHEEIHMNPKESREKGWLI